MGERDHTDMSGFEQALKGVGDDAIEDEVHKGIDQVAARLGRYNEKLCEAGLSADLAERLVEAYAAFLFAPAYSVAGF